MYKIHLNNSEKKFKYYKYNLYIVLIYYRNLQNYTIFNLYSLQIENCSTLYLKYKIKIVLILKIKWK